MALFRFAIKISVAAVAAAAGPGLLISEAAIWKTRHSPPMGRLRPTANVQSFPGSRTQINFLCNGPVNTLHLLRNSPHVFKKRLQLDSSEAEQQPHSCERVISGHHRELSADCAPVKTIKAAAAVSKLWAASKCHMQAIYWSLWKCHMRACIRRQSKPVEWGEFCCCHCLIMSLKFSFGGRKKKDKHTL